MRKRHYEGLLCMIMEAKKSPNLLSSSRRSRKASGTVQSKPKVLRTKGVNGINLSLGPKAQELEGECQWAGEDGVSCLKQRPNCPSSRSWFCSGPQQIDAYLHWLRSFSFPWSTDSNVSLFQKHTQRHIQKKVFSQLSGHSLNQVKLTHKINQYRQD